VICDVLTGEGWDVAEMHVGTAAKDVAAIASERRVELVVMPTSRAADLLADAAAYTELRRLDDPPLIVACSLGERDDTRRARAAGADAFFGDLDELLAFVDGRSLAHVTADGLAALDGWLGEAVVAGRGGWTPPTT
jgi:hypothetical protein